MLNIELHGFDPIFKVLRDGENPYFDEVYNKFGKWNTIKGKLKNLFVETEYWADITFTEVHDYVVDHNNHWKPFLRIYYTEKENIKSIVKLIKDDLNIDVEVIKLELVEIEDR